ncbi:hypothetical protein [Pasteuria penetrans]|uniref:hypothetical protein n=1 Tax=Pasteuria penetrans TaxID=86005 RepID=UPI000FB07F37|nr:hypothetical protein [Pasteuria penetrans]
MNRTNWILSALFTFGSLVGGFYLHQNSSIRQPVQETIHNMPDLQIKDLSISPRELKISLYTGSGFSLWSDYPSLESRLQEIARERKIRIQLLDLHSTRSLQTAWESLKFPLYGAIEQHQWADLPKLVQQYAYDLGSRCEVRLMGDKLLVALREPNGNHSIYREIHLYKKHDN